MSRVAIRDLYMDIADNCYDYADKEFDIIVDTEIVPRKIVEKIIEMCKKNEDELRPYYGEPFEDGQDIAYTNIREYAESLLKQFEEDKE